MNLCVFAGTFNPIHLAHLKMAQYVVDNFGFDKILFIPAYKPAHKDYDIQMCLHRLNMVKLATASNPKFKVCDVEYKSEGKSYSYITAKKLYEKYGKISFIIGTDAFEKIETWYETDKLKKIVDFIVFIRENEPVNLDWLKEKGYNFKIAPMNFIDISSTNLRERIKTGKPISDFVTKEVEDYIQKYGLYKN